jgi:hypothetical protein
MTGDQRTEALARLRAELAERLERALDDEVKVLALTIDDRAVILRALDDPPEELAELRAVLLNEHVWWQREGLDS